MPVVVPEAGRRENTGQLVGKQRAARHGDRRGLPKGQMTVRLAEQERLDELLEAQVLLAPDLILQPQSSILQRLVPATKTATRARPGLHRDEAKACRLQQPLHRDERKLPGVV